MKKYTSKDYQRVLKDVLATSFEHIEMMMAELLKLPKKQEEMTIEQKEKMMRLNTALFILNDSVHPAIPMAYHFYPKYKEHLDMYVKNQQMATEKGLVAPCFCATCDPDGSKTKQKAESLQEASI